jgi:hypothetical protein
MEIRFIEYDYVKINGGLAAWLASALASRFNKIWHQHDLFRTGRWCVGVTLWARAGMLMIFKPGRKGIAGWLAAKRVHGVDYLVDLRPDHPVEDVPAIASIGDQPGIAQYHQMLRDVRLAQAKHGFHVTDALLPIPQDIQDCQASGVHQHFEELGLRLIFFHR